MYSVVILANGLFPSTEKLLELLSQADKVVCCDGAAEKLLMWGREPDLIVGDMDSLSDSLKKRYSDIIRKCDGQEDNDLSKAFRACLDFHPSSIHILGATGIREDHTLANVSLLAEYTELLKNTDCTVDIMTDSGVFYSGFESMQSYECKEGAEVSIFAFDNTLKMTCEGLKYQTDHVIFDSLWKASLNMAKSSKFVLKLNHPAKVIVFICND